MKRQGLGLLIVVLGLTGCNAAKQAASTPASTPTTSMTAGTWVVTINNFIGARTDTVTVVNLSPNGTLVYDGAGPSIGYTSCDNGGLTYTVVGQAQSGGTPVVGPACFVALGGGANATVNGVVDGNITSTNANDEVLDFIIGVPTNPTPNGSAFNIQYSEEEGGNNSWQMDGSGTINNGTATGTWVCDPSTPACSGITGTFTATQQ
jgi:hypothetical protein